MAQVLTVSEVSTFIHDLAENNHLIDGKEFDNTVIQLAMSLAVSSFNTMPPVGATTLETFPSKDLLLQGTLWKMFEGQSALLARNTMTYSDGGLDVPVEERFQLYQQLASMYQASFLQAARDLKTHLNLEDCWGSVSSDYGYFPLW